MITGAHSIIRTAEADDAAFLRRLYDPDRPRAALLDRRREPLTPTLDELREVLGGRTKGRQAPSEFLAVEDTTGSVVGFCTMRTSKQERNYAQFVLMLFEEDAYDSPLAEETLAFLKFRAFQELKLNKATAHCLDCESGFRNLLVRNGFESDGVQREVLFTRGRWHNVESMTLFPDKA